MTTEHAGFEIVPGRPSSRRPSGSADSEAFITDEHVSSGPSGSSRQNAVSQVLLRRYLLTRALGSSIRNAVQWLGIALLVIGVLLAVAGLKVLGVLVLILAIGVLLVRALLSSVQRRLSGASQLGSYEREVQALVGQTRKGLRSELRRVGLPGSVWGPLLIALRLARRRRRAETVSKLVAIDLTSVVPQSRIETLNAVLARAH